MFKRIQATFLVSAIGLLGLSAGCFERPGGGGAGTDQKVRAAPTCVTAEEAARMADQVLQLVNLERSAADKGLSPVVRNDKLGKVAEEYACRMIELGFFGHRDPITGRGPGSRAIAGKYAFFAIGENLAAGQETPAEVMKVWMESPDHRDIILDPKWRDAGIAVRSGGEYSIYWVQVFGHPAEGL